jgi:COMPASS component SWD3
LHLKPLAWWRYKFSSAPVFFLALSPATGPIMEPPSVADNASTDDETASQTTEDDPQVPESVAPAPPQPEDAQTSSAAAQPVASSSREKPHYELRHTMTGHTQSISSVKFSPDGSLLASCGS